MASILTEYKLFDEDNCTIAEDGDVISIETYKDTYKEVVLTGVRCDSITIESDDCDETEIKVEDIIEFELD